MKKTILTLCAFLVGIWLYGQSPKQLAEINEAGNLANAKQYMQKQQVGFEENKGQITGADAPNVRYTYKVQGLSVFLLNNGIAYQFSKTHYPEGYKHLDKFAKREEQEQMEELAKNIRIETYRMDMELVGANPNALISTEGKSKDYIQYYNHNALEVHSYSKITYHNVYPNIDWVIYTKGGKGIKYEFVVHPGGNPNQIKLQTSWVEDLVLNQDGSLTLQNRMGNITEQAPVSFQGEKEIQTHFIIENNSISFGISQYNSSETLIIDPNLVWATYYGGFFDDAGFSCSIDPSGNVYMVGYTNSITSIAAGGHQNTYGGGEDAFLVKFNSAGIRKWATYYGGSNGERGFYCDVDASGNVYMAGISHSTIGISAGGHQNTLGGRYDAFLVKFNSSGIRQWATYYGGEYEEYGNSCSVDASGNVYLAGYTYTTTSTSSIADGGHQNTYGGGIIDAFLVKFNSAGIRQWATYYGGIGEDVGQSCVADAFGNVYLAGNTNSITSIAAGGHQNTIGGGGGGSDAFLVKFNAVGVRQWATYYGGLGGLDVGNSCQVDAFGNVYMAGQTGSATFISAGGHQNTVGGNSDAFLVKFNSSGIRQWATYYGGIGEDVGQSCVVDASENIYLAGYTTSVNSIAEGGHQNTFGGFFDAFLVKFNSAGIRQWATYYGGIDDDFGFSCVVDASENIYLAGYTTSVTSIAEGGHQNTYGDGGDAFLAKFDNFCVPTVSISATPTTICPGVSITFTATPINGGSAPIYQWTLNGSNVGTHSPIYSNNALANNDKVKVTLTSNATCATGSPAISNEISMSVQSIKPKIVGDIDFCFGDSTLLDAGAGFASYLWSNGKTTQTVYASNSGNLNVRVSNASGCIGRDTIAVIEFLEVKPVIAGTTSFCFGGNSNLDAGVGYFAYTWSNGQTTQMINVSNSDTYAVVVEDANGCFGKVDIVITENPEIIIIGSSTDAICFGTNTGTATVVVSGGTPGYTYLWSNGKTTNSATGLVKGTYTVTVEDSNNCPQISVPIVVNEPVALQVSVNTNSLFCQDDSATAIVSGGTAPYTYLWNNGSTEQSLSNLGVGQYSVAVMDANLCKASDLDSIVEVKQLAFDLVATPITCFGDNDGIIEIQNVLNNQGLVRFLVNGSNPQTSNTIGNLSGGNYTITLLDSVGCSLDKTTTINEPAPLLLDLGVNTTLLLGESSDPFVPNVVGNQGELSYLWTPDTYLTCTDCEQPICEVPFNTTNYTLVITDTKGCTTSDNLLVTVEKPYIIYVPTAFSPNGDGTNDLLQVMPAIDLEKVNVFRVFNRWGEMVYEAYDFVPAYGQFGWDGYLKGSKSPLDVYIYQVDATFIDGKTMSTRGQSTLLR